MKFIITVIFKALKILIRGVLSPINSIVATFLPDVVELTASVSLFFQQITAGILWVKSWLPFTEGFYTVLVSVLIFKMTVPLMVHALKLILKWYYMLKP